MHRLPFAIWLALLSLGLVGLVVAGLAPAGLGMLRDLAVENARARVQLAAASAIESLHRYAGNDLKSARLLAERPTLLRLVASGRDAEVERFLSQFRATGELDGCAVVTQGALLAATPDDLPWPAIVAGGRGGPFYLAGSARDAPALVVATVPLNDPALGEAFTVRRLDRALARRLSQQVGLPVRILPGGGGAPETRPETVRSGANWVARRAIDDSGVGDPGFVEVALPASEVETTLGPLEHRFALVTVAAALVAIAGGIFAARRLSRPLAALQAAAHRIGDGDLATPVPRSPGVETGALAATMELMRQRLRLVTAQLRHREAEATAILEGIVEGVFVVDRERRIEYLNPPALARLGITAEAALGRFCGDVLRPRARDGERPCDTSCPIVHARSRGSSRAVEQLQLEDGLRSVVITSAPPAGSKQVQVLRDETEIEAARRTRDAILANVSHELKTPLSAQLASIELLRDELERTRSEARIELVDSLERSTLRLTLLIDNLLESVRIETGRAAVRSAPVDLEAIAEEAAATTRPLLAQRRQTLAVDLPGPLRATGDPGPLVQVFVNLLGNASKFAPEDSTIRIGGARGEAAVSVWVEDRGPGVSGSERETVFERFHRGDHVVGEGTGLGLWIARSIVERHGGTVAVTAAEEGGARFTVTLPAGAEP